MQRGLQPQTLPARDEAPAEGLSVTVITPAYNAEKTIAACLQSLFANDYPNFNVIVVDDSSRDGTVGTAQRFPCELIRQPVNKGPGAARNAGAKQAQGDILLFIDADCVAPPDWISRYVRLFTENADTACICSGYSATVTKGYWARFQFLDTCYQQQFTPPHPRWASSCNFGCRRAAFWDAGGFPEIYLNEDMEFFFFLSEKHKILWQPQLGVAHHFHEPFYKYARQQYGWGKSVVETYLRHPQIFFAEGTVNQTGLSMQLLATLLVWAIFATTSVLTVYDINPVRPFYMVIIGVVVLLISVKSQNYREFMLRNKTENFHYLLRLEPTALIRNHVWLAGMLHAAIRNFYKFPRFIMWWMWNRKD